MNATKTYSVETLIVLRNCRFDGGEIDGVQFVRCIPRPSSYGEDGADGWKLSPQAASAMARRVVAEISDAGVIVANNPEFGGDYVRVSKSTATFRLICHMKS